MPWVLRWQSWDSSSQRSWRDRNRRREQCGPAMSSFPGNTRTFPFWLIHFALHHVIGKGKNLTLYLSILHHATKTCISWSGAIAECELGLTARKIRPATTMISRAAIWKVRVWNPSIKRFPKVKTCLPLSQLPRLELWLPIWHSSSSQQSENLMVIF